MLGQTFMRVSEPKEGAIKCLNTGEPWMGMLRGKSVYVDLTTPDLETHVTHSTR